MNLNQVASESDSVSDLIVMPRVYEGFFGFTLPQTNMETHMVSFQKDCFLGFHVSFSECRV